MMVRLGDVCTINPRGSVFPDSFEVSFIPMQSVTEEGNVDASLIKKYQEVKKGFTSFRENDVLFAKITPCMENGKGGIACKLKNEVGFGSTEFHVLRPNPDLITSKWLYYLTSWPAFRKECEKNMTGSAGQKRVPKTFLENYMIELPELSEQRRIAATLDKVTDLISKRRQQLDKLDELVKARFVEMFGDLFINSHHLPIAQFGSVLSVQPQNGLYKPQTDYVTGSCGVPILRIDGFYNGKVTDFRNLRRLNCSSDEMIRFSLSENDIVINRVNSIEYLGKCGLINGLLETTVYESNMMRLHVDEKKLNARYVTQLLCSKYIYNQILNRAKKAVNQASINQKDVQSLTIYIPPLELQDQFATFAEQTEKAKATISRSLEKLETLKKALLQEYFGVI